MRKQLYQKLLYLSFIKAIFSFQTVKTFSSKRLHSCATLIFFYLRSSIWLSFSCRSKRSSSISSSFSEFSICISDILDSTSTNRLVKSATLTNKSSLSTLSYLSSVYILTNNGKSICTEFSVFWPKFYLTIYIYSSNFYF